MKSGEKIQHFLSVFAFAVTLIVMACASLSRADQVNLQEGTVAIAVDGIERGDVPALLNESDPTQFKVNADAVIKLISGPFIEGSIEKLRAVQKDGWLDAAAFASAGFHTRFELESLTLSITPDDGARTIMEIPLNRPASIESATELVVPPAGFSGYLNARASNTYNSGTKPTESRTINTQGVLSFDQFVAETVMERQSDREHAWRREETQLSYDDRVNSVRWILGDLALPPVGYSSAIPLGGLSVSRDYSMRPNFNATPVAQSTFTLNKPSRVDVYVSGQMVRSLNLNPGKYNVSDLPLVTGLNDIELVIVDNLGRVERIRFPFISTVDLLRPGISKFSHNVGYPSTPTGADFTYDKKKPTYSGFHQYGLTERLTLGAYGQSDPSLWMGGLQAAIASGLGLLSFEGAQSQGYRIGKDYNYRARLRGWPDSPRGLAAWTIGYEYRGRNFTSLGASVTNQLIAHDIDVSISPRLGRAWTLSVGGRYRYIRDNRGDEREALASLYRGLGSGWSCRIDVSRTAIGSHTFDNRLYAALLWSGSTGLTGQTSYDTRGQTNRVDALYSRNGLEASAAAQHADTGDAGGVRVQETAQIAQVGVNANGSRSSGTANSISSTEVFAGTALVFTPKAVTISAPVTNSFAIITKDPKLKDQNIEINRMGDASEVSLGYWRRAVLRDIQQYNEHRLVVDSASLRDNVQLTHESYLVSPGYRSGHTVEIKVKSLMTVSGRLLLNNSEKAIPLVAGDVVKNDGGTWQASELVFFTDENGRFLLEGLTPGTWRVVFHDSTLAPFEFVVKEESEGEINVGDIHVQRK
jgi:outer membrane usher protein